MFYSHDILTSRKYGVATIWLVATLGSKSNLKKVSRKAILDVNVRKACETILTPEAPLALRLQSNLLYGVTRVYSQQCGYVLNDVESARNNMRALFNAVQTAELEPEGTHQARTEQLVLQSDPAFLLDLDLIPVDPTDQAFGAPIAGDSQQSFLSPHSTQAFSSSSQNIGGIIIPPSQSPSVRPSLGRGDITRFPEDSEVGQRLASAQILEDDLGLIIDPDGTVRMDDFTPSQPTHDPVTVAPQSVGGNTHNGNDMGQVQANIVEDMPMQAEDGSILFALQDYAVPPSDPADLDFPLPTQATSQEETASENIQASLHRRKRVLKEMPLDHTTELHNSDIARWNTGYLSDMRDALRLKDSGKLSALARNNAAYWVLGSIHDPEVDGPLHVFTGVRLLEAFSGLKLLPRGQKRRYEEDPEAFPEGRRIRNREDVPEDEVGRGAPEETYQDNNLIVPMDGDTVEQGRNAPTPLDDRYLSNVFPWSHSAGSRRPSNIPSSGSLPALGRHLSMLGRRGGRMTSASPLLGRGTLGGDEMDGLQFPDPVIPSTDDDDRFEIFGPAAPDGTQTTVQSEWQRAASDGDGMNFLAFVQNAIEDANLVHQQLAVGDEEAGTFPDSIEFETLLPPGENTNIVAAQALMHVLALVTKGRLDVQQTEFFGPIVLRVRRVT